MQSEGCLLSLQPPLTPVTSETNHSSLKEQRAGGFYCHFPPSLTGEWQQSAPRLQLPLCHTTLNKKQ